MPLDDELGRSVACQAAGRAAGPKKARSSGFFLRRSPHRQLPQKPGGEACGCGFFQNYVAVEPPSEQILGYYTLGPHAIDISTLPEGDQKRMPRRPTIGAIYLSMVGAHRPAQGRGLGSYLLADALRKCVAVANITGGSFIVLDALNRDAARLCRRIGFHDLPAPGQERRMLMSMAKARAAVAA